MEQISGNTALVPIASDSSNAGNNAAEDGSNENPCDDRGLGTILSALGVFGKAILLVHVFVVSKGISV